MPDFDWVERDFGKRWGQDSGSLSQVGPRCRPGRRLEDRVDGSQVVQLVSMGEELQSAAVMVTWSMDERQGWHTGWCGMPQHSEHMDTLAQTLPLVFRVWASLEVVGNLAVRVW